MRTDHTGARFYEATDVNHARVREAMADAGNRTTPYPLAWLGVTGHKYLIRSRPRPDEPLQLPGHDYGPHRPEDAPKRKAGRELTYVDGQLTLRVMRGWAWYSVLVDEPLLMRQREQINRTAYEGSRKP